MSVALLVVAIITLAVGWLASTFLAARRFERAERRMHAIEHRLNTIDNGDWSDEDTDRITKSLNGSRHV